LISIAVFESLIGQVDVKTKIVHFFVQRNTPFTYTDVVIPFDLARVNEGNAFNLKSGIFIVPVPGIYHFDLTAQKCLFSKFLGIFLQVNGTDVGAAYTWQTATGNSNVVSLSASLRLAAGDSVKLFNSRYNHARAGGVCDNGDTHFTGGLVEEDLM